MGGRVDSRRTEFPLAGQGGFTIVEALVAGLMLMIGGLGALQLLDASTRNTYRAEESQVAINRIQRELEVVRRLPYEEIALNTSSPPAFSSDENHPLHRVSGTRFALGRDGTNLAPLVYNGSALEEGGTVTNGAMAPATTFTSGDVSGTVHRFVVWQNDFGCPESRCAGDQDIKRVVIAVKLDDAAVSFERSYQEIHSDFADPEAHQETQPTPEVPNQVQAQQFWLSDTTCNLSTREALSDHAAHNTLGECADGPQTGVVPGAPDLLLTQKPPVGPSYDNDFATDLEPSADPAADRGLQLSAQSGDGCDYTPEGIDAQHQVHRWLTPAMTSTYSLEGDASLSLFTRTMPGASHPGKVCVYLFRREINAFGNAVDHLMADADNPGNSYFTRALDPWSTGADDTVSVPMEFAQTNVLEGERLGVAISVERAGTDPGEALQFAYDDGGVDSRLEVTTSTPTG
jgi:hypothetical protein